MPAQKDFVPLPTAQNVLFHFKSNFDLSINLSPTKISLLGRSLRVRPGLPAGGLSPYLLELLKRPHRILKTQLRRNDVHLNK